MDEGTIRLGRCLAFLLAFLLIPTETPACSCLWKGPFLVVAKEAPLVIRARILDHHPGKAPTMSVLVLETFVGGLLDTGLVIQMGDGMHCRPTLENFPKGSEWVLALNGPGSKPGNGVALSHCGQYWLRVQGNEVVGSIDGSQGEVQRMPIRQIRDLLQIRH